MRCYSLKTLNVYFNNFILSHRPIARWILKTSWLLFKNLVRHSFSYSNDFTTFTQNVTQIKWLCIFPISGFLDEFQNQSFSIKRHYPNATLNNIQICQNVLCYPASDLNFVKNLQNALSVNQMKIFW